MEAFEMNRLFPRFLREDADGRAMVAAICAAMDALKGAVQAGINLMTDPDEMPEWRLDESAREMDIPYNYNGTMAEKRYWIKNAYALYRHLGTPQAIRDYLGSLAEKLIIWDQVDYTRVAVDFHFRVFTQGTLTQERRAWAAKALETIKNVRSTNANGSVDAMRMCGVAAKAEIVPEYGYETGESALEDEAKKIMRTIIRTSASKGDILAGGTVTQVSTLSKTTEGDNGFTANVHKNVSPATTAERFRVMQNDGEVLLTSEESIYVPTDVNAELLFFFEVTDEHLKEWRGGIVTDAAKALMLNALMNAITKAYYTRADGTERSISSNLIKEIDGDGNLILRFNTSYLNDTRMTRLRFTDNAGTMNYIDMKLNNEYRGIGSNNVRVKVSLTE